MCWDVVRSCPFWSGLFHHHRVRTSFTHLLALSLYPPPPCEMLYLVTIEC